MKDHIMMKVFLWLLVVPVFFLSYPVWSERCTLSSVVEFAQPVIVTALAVDNQGNLYFAIQGSPRIEKIAPDGDRSAFNIFVEPVTINVVFPSEEPRGTPRPRYFEDYFVDHISGVYDLFFDTVGNLYLADRSGDPFYNLIWKAAPDGQATLVAGGGTGSNYSLPDLRASDISIDPMSISVTPAGELLVGERLNVLKIAPISLSGNVSLLRSGEGGGEEYFEARDIHIDSNGVIYVSNFPENGLWRHLPDGTEEVIGVSSEAYCESRIGTVDGITSDPEGNVYVAVPDCRKVQKMTPQGEGSSFAGTTEVSGFQLPPADPLSVNIGEPYHVAFEASGRDLYIASAGHTYPDDGVTIPPRIYKVDCQPSPDLVIENPRTMRGRRGRLLISAEIANRGDAIVRGPVNLEVRPAGATTPIVHTILGGRGSKGSLAAGRTAYITFSVPTATSWELTIDVGLAVEESNEENNTFTLTP